MNHILHSTDEPWVCGHTVVTVPGAALLPLCPPAREGLIAPVRTQGYERNSANGHKLKQIAINTTTSKFDKAHGHTTRKDIYSVRCQEG